MPPGEHQERPRYANGGVCNKDWDMRNPRREAVRELFPEVRQCVYCGKDTLSGIIQRVDIAEVPFPPKQNA